MDELERLQLEYSALLNNEPEEHDVESFDDWLIKLMNMFERIEQMKWEIAHQGTENALSEMSGTDE